MLRQSLAPDLLRAVERNRHNVEQFNLVELGSVFLPSGSGDQGTGSERRHLGLACVLRGGAKVEDRCLAQLKTALESLGHIVLDRSARFVVPSSDLRWPWQHANKTAEISIGDRTVGYVTVMPEALKGRIHEHLRRWSVGLAEVCLDELLDLPAIDAALPHVPDYPQVQLDFSILADADRSFVQIGETIKEFEHPLLRRLTFLDSYQGSSLPEGTRSLTLRAWIGHPDRTLTDEDRHQFDEGFKHFLARNDLPLRS
jgi:phenylalanyl-tRNA synthetase beta subunit